MPASMSRERSLFGVLLGMLSVGVLGCSPTAAPVSPAKPVAAHADPIIGGNPGTARANAAGDGGMAGAGFSCGMALIAAGKDNATGHALQAASIFAAPLAEQVA
jgi:hypothetical protein